MHAFNLNGSQYVWCVYFCVCVQDLQPWCVVFVTRMKTLKLRQALHQVLSTYLCREVSACFVLMILIAMLEWPHAKMAADSRHRRQ